MSEETYYEKLGETNLELLINHFYDLVFDNSILQKIFKGDKDEIKRKQTMFLTQFLGGPALYTMEFGHPQMRMRHLPHAITNEAKEEWLKCMKASIDQLPIEEIFKSELFNCFPKIANHMVNR